ncbi:MAG: Gfo/Idh/MocA family oxidoreductase [Candidatus Staskawiczbacteria bacterium]|nr:Gfo/Idh/MocA family oxidoreductase [Candidatus Staskawiczbacteria bacterium]
MSNKLNAAIIGAGNIGAFYDNPSSRNILTHAHAYTNHPGFKLVGFVDNDIKKAEQAAKIWGGSSAKTISELRKNIKIDVVSICAPDEEHYKILKETAKTDILGGIIEKPLTDSLEDSRKIIGSEFFKSRKFLVNYTRRFVPEFHDLKKMIAGGKYGKFLTGNGVYGKGFLHNGSHLIDLLRYFFGEIKNKKMISEIYDFSRKDPTVSAVLKLRNGKEILLNAIDSRHFTIFELDLFFEKARIRIINNGFEMREYFLSDDATFKGYKNVSLGKTTKTSMGKALYYAVDNLYDAIIRGGNLICDIKDGYEAQKICAK